MIPLDYTGVPPNNFEFVAPVLAVDRTRNEYVVPKVLEPDGSKLGWIFSG